MQQYVLVNGYYGLECNSVRQLKSQVSILKVVGFFPFIIAYLVLMKFFSNTYTTCLMLAEKSSWPSLKTLFLLRLWSMIFPCSDFRHVVMTPATLLMCEYLMRCPILSGYDIAIGCFLCSMVLSVCER